MIQVLKTKYWLKIKILSFTSLILAYSTYRFIFNIIALLKFVAYVKNGLGFILVDFPGHVETGIHEV